MEFRRKTKILSGLPHAAYVTVFLLIISVFYAKSPYLAEEKETQPIENTTVLESNPITKNSDTIVSKPEIYIPDIEMIPADTTALPVIAETPLPEEKKETALIADNSKKATDVKQLESKKTDEKSAADKKITDKKDKSKETYTKIGTDRKITAFIPGTNGKGGKLPKHNCNVKGQLIMIFTVDETGNVIRAGRSGGINNDCATTAAVIWLKQYVKTEKADSKSKGSYTITF